MPGPLKKTPFRYALNLFAAIGFYALVMLLVNTSILNRYQALMLIPIGFNIILAVSLNLSVGFLGQLPLGHAGFMSVGGYAAALFSMSTNLPTNIELPLALLVGGAVAALFGVLIGLPALRLKGDYLAIITLGFGEIIRVIILNMKFTGGAYGLKGIGRQTTITWVYIFVLFTLFIINTLIKSRHGRAILSIREDETAAEASGIPTTYYKVLAFTVSAGFAGIAGGLYAHYLSILDPSTFGFMRSVEILVIVVLGGLGSIFGSVISATVLTILPELLRGFAEYRMVIYSLLLVVVMIFKPSGLCGRYDFSLGDSLDKFFAMIRRAILKNGGDSDAADS
ncbi:MAG: branched-chain amino acid ABC transporter permease [Synergistaceae bacterium]|jgi:branched-chain amino acid transport system permease protein|nr:branched-chain amino acid ABC transporter permease [Synergistaceae bacterium]